MENRDSILGKIRGLMQKTVMNGCTEAEAMLAAEKVDELMQEYEVQMSDLQFQEQVCDKLIIDTGGRKRHAIEVALSNIAYFTDTRFWYNTGTTRKYIFFGMEKDREIAEYLYYLMRRAADRGAELFGMFNPDLIYKETWEQHSSADSFRIGLCRRVGDRLSELKRLRTASMHETTGRDLVVVKSAVVTEAFAALHMRMGIESEYGKAVDHDAFVKGSAAGEKVQLTEGIKSYAQRNQEIQ